MKNLRLIELLKARNMTIRSLAKMIFSGSPHLVQVLRGQRNGTPTWNKLRRIMTAEELLCAMEFANGTLAAQNIRLELEMGESPRVVAKRIDTNVPVRSVNVLRGTPRKLVEVGE
jgi:transcriptional regulator with XRE-family HTH domain